MTNRQLLLLLAVLAAVLIGCGRSNRQLISSSGETAASAAFREKAQERWAALLNDPRTEVLASYENADDRSDATETEPPMLAENASGGNRFNPVAGLRNLIRRNDDRYPADPFLTASADGDSDDAAMESDDSLLPDAFAERDPSGAANDRPDDALQNQFDRLIANSNDRLDNLERRLTDSAAENRTAALDNTAAAFGAANDALDHESFVGNFSNEAARANAQIDSWENTAEGLTQMLETTAADSDSGQSFDQLLGLEAPAVDRAGNADSAEVLLSQNSRDSMETAQRNPFALASETAVSGESDVSLPLLKRYADEQAVPPFEESMTESIEGSFEAFVATAELSVPDAADIDSTNPSHRVDETDSFESFLLREEGNAEKERYAGLDVPQGANDDMNVSAAADGLLEVPFPEDALSDRASIPAAQISIPAGVANAASEPTMLAMAGEASSEFQPPLPQGFDSGTFDQAFHGIGLGDDASLPSAGGGLAVTSLSEPVVHAQDPPVWDVVAEARRVSPRSWFFIIGCVVVVALLVAPRRSRRDDG